MRHAVSRYVRKKLGRKATPTRRPFFSLPRSSVRLSSNLVTEGGNMEARNCSPPLAGYDEEGEEDYVCSIEKRE